MSAGDGRHKIGSSEEARLHREICAATRLAIDLWCARQAQSEEQRSGRALKKSVFRDDLAGRLGVSARQLDQYAQDVPVTLAKAMLLSRITGDDRLLVMFAQELCQVPVPLPSEREIEEWAFMDANLELWRNSKEFTEFQSAALALADKELTPDAAAAIRKEGFEGIRQSLRVMLLADFRADGALTTPLLARAQAGRHQRSENR